MKLLTNGKTLITVPGSHTGTVNVKNSLRFDFLQENHASIDATCFLPAGSSVGSSSPNGFVYSLDPLVMRDGHY
jgi:hypothetical protein